MTVILNGTVNAIERDYKKVKNNVKYGTGLALTGAAYLAINKDSYASKKAAQGANFLGKKITNLVAKTKIGGKIIEYATKAKNFVKPVFTKAGNVLTSIKNSSVVQNAAAKALPYIKKIPFKPIAVAATLITAGILIHNHGKNSGKIDQKYADKEALTQGIRF